MFAVPNRPSDCQLNALLGPLSGLSQRSWLEGKSALGLVLGFTRQDCRSVGGPGLSQKCLVEVFDRLGLQLAVKCWSGISLGLVPAVELIGNQSGFCFQFPSDWSRQWIGFGLNTGLTAPETSRARVN